jgi:hypothetical protein
MIMGNSTVAAIENAMPDVKVHLRHQQQQQPERHASAQTSFGVLIHALHLTPPLLVRVWASSASKSSFRALTAFAL